MKKINILLILILLISSFTVHVKEAHACSWIRQTPLERMTASDLVVRGKVTAFTKSTVMEGETKMDVNKITVSVNNSWKGPAKTSMTFTSSMAAGTSCYPARAEVGKEYIIFAKAEGGIYTVNELDVQEVKFITDDISTLGVGTKVGATITATTSVGSPKPVVISTTTSTTTVTATTTVAVTGIPATPVEKESVLKRFFRWLSNLF